MLVANCAACVNQPMNVVCRKETVMNILSINAFSTLLLKRIFSYVLEIIKHHINYLTMKFMGYF